MLNKQIWLTPVRGTPWSREGLLFLACVSRETIAPTPSSGVIQQAREVLISRVWPANNGYVIGGTFAAA